jgi:hypothetical protein
MTLARKLLTQGRREKETEMVWRGKQYVRGIKQYYLKTGRVPQSLDELPKPRLGDLRFMRQAYKDSVNPDGNSQAEIRVNRGAGCCQ